MSVGSAIGAGIGLLGGSKKSGNTTQTSSPWGGVQPHLIDLYNNANNVFQNPAYNFKGPALGVPAANQLNQTIRGDFLRPESNPFLRDSVNDALGLAKSQFAGQFGGQAGGNLGNSGYQEMLMRTLGNIATNAYGNAYGQERQNQLQAAQLGPQIDVANAQAPFAELQAFKGILEGAPGGSVSQPYFTNPIGGALGGALAGGQVFGMMNKPNPFTGVGAYPY